MWIIKRSSLLQITLILVLSCLTNAVSLDFDVGLCTALICLAVSKNKMQYKMMMNYIYIVHFSYGYIQMRFTSSIT